MIDKSFMKEFDGLFTDIFGSSLNPMKRPKRSDNMSYSITTRTINDDDGTTPIHSVKKSEGEVEIQLVLTGYTVDDVTINVQHNVLTVAGEVKDEVRREIVEEFTLTKFNKTFNISPSRSNITTKLENGILTITINQSNDEVDDEVENIPIET